jgi:regulator of RNase E activity RraA
VVRPGDVIFAVCDGAVCVPRGIACDVLPRAEEIRESEKKIFVRVASGGTVKEITGKGGCF